MDRKAFGGRALPGPDRGAFSAPIDPQVPMELLTRYTSADIVLGITSMSVQCKYLDCSQYPRLREIGEQ